MQERIQQVAEMITRTLTIAAPDGLHARPVGELVKLVKTFPGAKVTLATAARTVNAASMLSILSLGLKKGTEVTLAVDGGDEAAVIEAVASFIDAIDQ